MATFLFNEIIFGPVNSRRLGESLGINLLPVNSKYCNFNCLYCECGFTPKAYGKNKKELPTREEVHTTLKNTLAGFREKKYTIDTITFAGNGEPTMHPDFPNIVDDTIVLRNMYFPDTKIAVLSNATRIARPEIISALSKVEYNILKLDSVNEETVKLINCPMNNFSLRDLLGNLKKIRNGLTIQTLFVRGEYRGKRFDNSTEEEVGNWLNYLLVLQPELVMIYTITRDTPVDSIQKIPPGRLHEIALQVQERGIQVSVSG